MGNWRYLMSGYDYPDAIQDFVPDPLFAPSINTITARQKPALNRGELGAEDMILLLR